METARLEALPAPMRGASQTAELVVMLTLQDLVRLRQSFRVPDRHRWRIHLESDR